MNRFKRILTRPVPMGLVLWATLTSVMLSINIALGRREDDQLMVRLWLFALGVSAGLAGVAWLLRRRLTTKQPIPLCIAPFGLILGAVAGATSESETWLNVVFVLAAAFALWPVGLFLKWWLPFPGRGGAEAAADGAAPETEPPATTRGRRGERRGLFGSGGPVVAARRRGPAEAGAEQAPVHADPAPVLADIDGVEDEDEDEDGGRPISDDRPRVRSGA